MGQNVNVLSLVFDNLGGKKLNLQINLIGLGQPLWASRHIPIPFFAGGEYLEFYSQVGLLVLPSRLISSSAMSRPRKSTEVPYNKNPARRRD
jgi:hypothetical protein